MNGRITSSPSLPKLFIAAAISLFTFGMISKTFSYSSPLDLQFHDTYFVISHFHVVVFVSFIFVLFAGIYYGFPFVFSRYMNRLLGGIHFGITTAGALMIFWPVHYQGILGTPRRYYDYTALESFKNYAHLNVFITTAVLAISFAQMLFCCNFLMSMLIGRKVIKALGS